MGEDVVTFGDVEFEGFLDLRILFFLGLEPEEHIVVYGVFVELDQGLLFPATGEVPLAFVDPEAVVSEVQLLGRRLHHEVPGLGFGELGLDAFLLEFNTLDLVADFAL
jgi:hypothetical protein